MKHLELHILQSFPVSCLNRDDLNSPKTAIFGGVQRARVSSQSWKRAIRENAAELLPKYFGAKRSRLIIKAVTEKLQSKGVDQEHALMLSKAIAHYLGKLDLKDETKVKTLMFLSPEEFNIFAEILVNLPDENKMALYEAFEHISPEDLEKEESNEDEDNPEEIKAAEQGKKKEKQKAMTAKQFSKLVSKILRTLIKGAFKNGLVVKDAADIALFGRMVANDPSLNIEGAAMFSHALSSHKVDNEIDYFSAIDDLQPKEDAGAGMTGTLEFNSATYYRFSALNLDMLKDKEHLGLLDQMERKEVVKAFIEATLRAVPGMGKNNAGRRNSMNAYTLPGYVIGIVRDKGHPVQLVNAFEKPVWGKGGKSVLEESIEKLKAEYDKLTSTWGFLKNDELMSSTIPDKTMNKFVEEVCQYVD
jgi:CRISPR system Cascade subunit CasC